ncbi:ligase-associated DNA damage response endonuclease PdeM [Sphingobium lignivorans]|uniref:ligase-associated DNA damage response endonuclease PdeM n=1 Tax=Sphingobium lignivorans TaxID=2735886 RepID=UPI00161BB207|nr:ligase-associated DNA damage response endonuclease PdeM [Sphingobium lignivorans]
MGAQSLFSFGGQTWRALPEGALVWQERSALILADLHFEKASAYACRGSMLPPYDSVATLDALEGLMARIRPREVWCLGDSFHDMGACDRMDEGTRRRITGLTASCRWIWITGNHDPRPTPDMGGETLHETRVADIILRHEARPNEAGAEISGHFHPKWRLNLRGRLVSRRCFVLSARKLIMPAFGAYAGGLDVAAPAIRALVGQGSEALVPISDRLLRFSVPA